MAELNTLSGRTASQRADELFPFIELLKERGVRSYLEIGARHGDTFYEVVAALPKKSNGIAVDLGGGPWGTEKSVPALLRATSRLYEQGYMASAVFGDSGSPNVIEKVKARGPYDAVLIDGDHRYDGVKRDWMNYGGLAPIVAFHDIVGEGQTTKDGSNLPVEVPRLWRELKSQFDHVEFVGPGSTMGIGVVLR